MATTSTETRFEELYGVPPWPRLGSATLDSAVRDITSSGTDPIEFFAGFPARRYVELFVCTEAPGAADLPPVAPGTPHATLVRVFWETVRAQHPDELHTALSAALAGALLNTDRFPLLPDAVFANVYGPRHVLLQATVFKLKWLERARADVARQPTPAEQELRCNHYPTWMAPALRDAKAARRYRRMAADFQVRDDTSDE